jgi:uncharacterized BrkB/YihY/UPF0761 family membrane protein
LAPAVFIGILYVATIVTGAVRWIASFFQIGPASLPIAGSAVSIALIASVSVLLYRWVGGPSIALRRTIIVSIVVAVMWEIVLLWAGAIVRVFAARFVAYGVLAWALVFLTFMRFIAEIILAGAIVISYPRWRRDQSVDT